MLTASSFLPIFGPIIAACIAASISFLALVISKENKTSEFRQAWIDDLRQDLAQFAANLRRLEAQTTYVDLKTIKASTLEEALEAQNERSIRPDFFAENRLKQLQSRYSIRLRLNPYEASGEALLAQVDKALEAYYSSGDVEAELESLMKLAQPILKQEWERVKKGEPVFCKSVLAMKWLAATLALLVLIGGACLVWTATATT